MISSPVSPQNSLTNNSKRMRSVSGCPADWEPKLYNSPKIWGHEMLPHPAATVISDGKQHKR